MPPLRLNYLNHTHYILINMNLTKKLPLEEDGTLVIGVDYGSDSVRALLVNAKTGEELAGSVFNYPRWQKGMYCNPAINQFRQHPLDYLEGLEFVIKELLTQHPEASMSVKAISIDTTGSTPAAVNEKGTPLALLPEFAENPNAMFILWKDHTAIREADEINDKSRSWGGVDFTKYSGGNYSSEWFWSKILHAIRHDKFVAESAFTWMEHCDWLPAMLTGNTEPHIYQRSRCATGHKAMWHEEWGGFPSSDFLEQLDNRLVKFRERMNDSTLTADKSVGSLCEEWAEKLGLPTSVVIGSGALDAHFGAVGAEIKPYHLCKVIGTSTCDMMVVPYDELNNKLIKGISGQVDGSVTPGFIGIEAGQSAFGDVFAWYKNLLVWPIKDALGEDGQMILEQSKIDEISDSIMRRLTVEAENIETVNEDLLALDWLNGRRTPDMNMHLKGALMGLTLGTDAPQIFNALVESTAFGAKAIVDRILEEGIKVEGVIALGGVAKKSEFVMQTLANVLNKPIKVVKSEETCALGAAMFASVVAGVYPTIDDAQNKLGKGFEKNFYPDEKKAVEFQSKYNRYKIFGNFVERENE